MSSSLSSSRPATQAKLALHLPSPTHAARVAEIPSPTRLDSARTASIASLRSVSSIESMALVSPADAVGVDGMWTHRASSAPQVATYTDESILAVAARELSAADHEVEICETGLAAFERAQSFNAPRPAPLRRAQSWADQYRWAEKRFRTDEEAAWHTLMTSVDRLPLEPHLSDVADALLAASDSARIVADKFVAVTITSDGAKMQYITSLTQPGFLCAAINQSEKSHFELMDEMTTQRQAQGFARWQVMRKLIGRQVLADADLLAGGTRFQRASATTTRFSFDHSGSYKNVHDHVAIDDAIRFRVAVCHAAACTAAQVYNATGEVKQPAVKPVEPKPPCAWLHGLAADFNRIMNAVRARRHGLAP